MQKQFKDIKVGEFFKITPEGNVWVKVALNRGNTVEAKSVGNSFGNAKFRQDDSVCPITQLDAVAEVNPPKPKFFAGEVVLVKDTPANSFIKPNSLVRIERGFVDNWGQVCYDVTAMLIRGSKTPKMQYDIPETELFDLRRYVLGAI